MAWKPDYTNLTEAKEFLRLNDNVDDVFLSTCITAASREMDRGTRRQFGNETVAVSREYEVKNKFSVTKQFASIDDLYDLTDIQVTLNGTDITTDCDFWPLNALSDHKVYEEVSFTPNSGMGTSRLVIIGLWGWPEVPRSITFGTQLLLNRFFSRRDAPFGVIGSAELGNQMNIARQDPDIQAIVRDYYRWW